MAKPISQFSFNFGDPESAEQPIAAGDDAIAPAAQDKAAASGLGDLAVEADEHASGAGMRSAAEVEEPVEGREDFEEVREAVGQEVSEAVAKEPSATVSGEAVSEPEPEIPVRPNEDLASLVMAEASEPGSEPELSRPAMTVVSRARTATAPTSTRGRKSLRDAALNVDLLDIPADEELYSRQYYSMREVSAMFHENQSLIRYWETEFDILQPKKNKKGDRFFRPVDVRNLELIYDLLRRRKFTIEGAREYLKGNKKAEQQFAMIQSLKQIRAFLLELKAGL